MICSFWLIGSALTSSTVMSLLYRSARSRATTFCSNSDWVYGMRLALRLSNPIKRRPTRWQNRIRSRGKGSRHPDTDALGGVSPRDRRGKRALAEHFCDFAFAQPPPGGGEPGQEPAFLPALPQRRFPRSSGRGSGRSHRQRARRPGFSGSVSLCRTLRTGSIALAGRQDGHTRRAFRSRTMKCRLKR